MMVDREMRGRAMGYRPMRENELTSDERRRVHAARPSIDDRDRAVRLGYLAEAESAPAGAPWFAIRVAFGREKAVESDLSERGIEAFVPMRKGPARMVRGRKRPALMIPAVTGYVIARTRMTDRICAGLTALDHVIQLVGADGVPYPVSDAEIRRFRSMADEGKLDWDNVSGVTYRPGEKVRIMAFHWAGFPAVVVSGGSKGKGDAVVEIDVLGRKTPVTLPLALLQKV